jgi:hypothetical protein
MVGAAALALGVLAGCSQPHGAGDAPFPVPGTAVAPDPVPAATPPADEVRAGDRARWTGDCARVVHEIQSVIAALPSPCEKAGDCVCHPGGIEAVSGCGGESDLAASRRISELTREFERLRCDYGVDCAPRLCESACIDGKCTYQRRGSIP